MSNSERREGRAPSTETVAATPLPVKKRAVRRARRVSRKSPLAEKAPKVSRGLAQGEGEREYFEPPELKRFFEHMPKTAFWRAYFFLQYFYATRISEVALFLETDVDFKKKKIKVKRLKKVQEESGYSETIYDADPRVLECAKIALRWKAQKKIPSPGVAAGKMGSKPGSKKAKKGKRSTKVVDGNPFLFATDRRRATESAGNERLSKLRTLDGWQAVSRMASNRAFKKVATEIKLPKNLQHSHALRHTRAIMLLAAGVPIEDVRALCGHTSVKMTEKYIEIAEAMRAKFGFACTDDALGIA